MNVSLMFIFSGNFQFETGLFSFYLIVNKRTLCCCLVEMSSQRNVCKLVSQQEANRAVKKYKPILFLSTVDLSFYSVGAGGGGIVS